MGTLAGHLLPGTFFILFAIWWGFITAIRYVQSRQTKPFNKRLKNNYKGSVTMPCIFLPCANMPLESYLKGVLAFIALLAEAYTGYKVHYKNKSEFLNLTETSSSQTEHHHHKRSVEIIRTWSFELGNAQHITMYSAFILGSIIEIMLHYGVDLPKRIDYAMGIIAFSIEGFLFAFHLHGKELIDVYIHTLLVYAVFGCVFFCCLEAYNPRQVMFTYGRILFTLLQGTWFYQVGFMLYPPTDNPAWQWNLSDHRNIMIVTICYCWHVLFIIIGLMFQFWFVKKAIFKSRKFVVNLERLIDSDRRSAKMTQEYFVQDKENTNLINGNNSSGDEDVVIDLNIQNNDRICFK